MLRVFVEVSDKYLWALRPFSYLFNIYWSSLQPVVVFGYSPPDFRLPENFSFYQISPQNYPADKWSNGMINVLNNHSDSHFVLLLADYWLIRTVDVRGVSTCHEYVSNRNDVLRIDLTDDRQYNGDSRDIDMWGSYDILETPFSSPYQMSTQAGIWNRELMLSLMRPDMSAWDVEIYTQPPPSMRVFGTRQRPVRYANAINKGKIDDEQISKIPEQHKFIIQDMIPYGWIP